MDKPIPTRKEDESGVSKSVLLSSLEQLNPMEPNADAPVDLRY